MSHSVLIAAPNQTIGYDLRTRVDELENFTVVDVADSTVRLVESVQQRDPEIVLIHDQVGPMPALQATRDVVARRPGTAVMILTEEMSPEVFAAAMDAGARGLLRYPVSVEELETRLPSAAEWVTQMRRHLVSDSGDAASGGRGRLVVVSGTKGGVGTTTIAAHLAHEAVTRVAGRSVCLVELNLDNGDISDFFGIEHRLDVSDLAKVVDDLTSQTIVSATHRSPTGLATLLGPSRIEDIGEVGERETVLIIAALRRQFDLVIVDAGGTVNPASAAAVSAADEVLLVTTPDLLSIRGAHRTIERWSRVQARNAENVKIVVNRVHRDADIQPDAASRLLPAAPISTSLPEAGKILQRGLNHQDPAAVVSKVWWDSIDRLGVELGVLSGSHDPGSAEPAKRRGLFKRAAQASSEEEPAPQEKKRQRVGADERGQATIEFSALIGIILMMVLLVWQIALWGVSAAYTAHAADQAAREAGIGRPIGEVREAALDAIPSFFRDGTEVKVTGSSPQMVEVRGNLPIIHPQLKLGGPHFTSRTPVVQEDR